MGLCLKEDVGPDHGMTGVGDQNYTENGRMQGEMASWFEMDWTLNQWKGMVE